MFLDYEAHGWKLCAIEIGKKAPVYEGWNVSPMPSESIDALGNGAGLLHALSGTCALDLDNLTAARPWLAERGVDVDALMAAPDAVMISSGRVGRAKLLYRIKKPMRTFKPKESGLELRCATAAGVSVQDVLPPTIHPDTKKPYEWVYGDLVDGHWSKLPNIPANLYALWSELADALPSGAAVESKPQDTPLETVRKAIMQYIVLNKKDVNNYDDWIEIGMRLHKQTSGAAEGLEVWDKWSSAGKTYKNISDLKLHWTSFHSDGAATVGMDRLIAELPATADEFPIEDTAPAEDDPDSEAAKVAVKKTEKRKAALDLLQSELIFVRSAEKYFNTKRHTIVGNVAIEAEYTPRMPAKCNPVKLLKMSPTKTIVDKLGFHPGEGTTFADADGDTYANTYRNRLPEPIEPMTDERETIEWLFDRIDDPVFREYLIQFYGHVVQYPGLKIKSAPLIWSDTQGNGKTTLVRVIPSLLVGPQYSREVNSSLLSSDFNDYLLSAWHVNLNEFRAGSRGERETISKKVESWIADPVIPLHQKGLAAVTIPNHLFVTSSSNADDAAAITNQDRKWAIHELRAGPMTEAEQRRVYGFLGNQKRAAAVLRHYFLNVDTAGFNPNARAPETAARAEMVEASISSDLECMVTAWEQGLGPFERDIVLNSEVMAYVHKNSPSRPNSRRVGKILSRAPFNGTVKQFRDGARVFRTVILRNKDRWLGAVGRDAAEALARGAEFDVEHADEVDLLS